ncbi:hypothetical protein D3C83_03470 [compost metagenome]
MRALADRDDDIGVAQVLQQAAGRRRGVSEDADIVSGELCQAVQLVHDAVIIVGNGDNHGRKSSRRTRAPGSLGKAGASG